MKFTRFKYCSLSGFIQIGLILLLSACASDVSQQEGSAKVPCHDSVCQKQKEKANKDIENTRNDGKRRSDMIKDKKQPIPGTYYPVDQNEISLPLGH